MKFVPSLTSKKFARRLPAGFTLIELVLVILILAILAGLIISRFGNVDKNAKFAAAISNITSVNRSMDTFKAVSKGKMPDGYDSLLATGGSAIYTGNGDPTVNSGVFSGWLTVGTLTSGELGSLRRISANVVPPGGPTNSLITVYDHDTTSVDPHTSTDNATARILDTTTNVAFVDPSTTAGAAIYRSIGESPTDTTFRLIALGVGSRCTLVGGNKFDITVAEPPMAGDPSPNDNVAYRRVVALYRVSATPQYFAEYATAVNSYGKTVASIRTFMQ